MSKIEANLLKLDLIYKGKNLNPLNQDFCNINQNFNRKNQQRKNAK